MDVEEEDLPPTQPIDNRILKDVVAFVEVRSEHDNRSKSVAVQLESLGATVSKHLNKKVTHVIFKDGRKSVYKKAKSYGVHFLSVLWIESCKENASHVSEKLFPAIVSDVYESDIVKLRKMKSMQPEDMEENLAKWEARIKRRRRLQEKQMRSLLPSRLVNSEIIAKDIYKLPDSIYNREWLLDDSTSEDEASDIVKLPNLGRRLLKLMPDSPILRDAFFPRKKRAVADQSQTSLRIDHDASHGQLNGSLDCSIYKSVPDALQNSPAETSTANPTGSSAVSTDTSRATAADNEPVSTTTTANKKFDPELGCSSDAPPRAAEVGNAESLAESNTRTKSSQQAAPTDVAGSSSTGATSSVVALTETPTGPRRGKKLPRAEHGVDGITRRRSMRLSAAAELSLGNGTSGVGKAIAKRSATPPERCAVTSSAHQELAVTLPRKSRKRKRSEVTVDRRKQRSLPGTSSSSIDARRSLDDFKPRNAINRKRPITRVSFDGSLNDSKFLCGTTRHITLTSFSLIDREVLVPIINQLGNFRLSVHVNKSTTHVICGANRRTINVIMGTALGCWMLRQEWIMNSMEAGYWLDEEPYEMSAEFPTARKSRAEKQLAGSSPLRRLFCDVGPVAIDPQSEVPSDKLKELLLVTGAKVVSNPRSASIYIGRRLRSQTCTSVHHLWVLDSIWKCKVLSVKKYLA